jgi:hypothetical protein
VWRKLTRGVVVAFDEALQTRTEEDNDERGLFGVVAENKTNDERVIRVKAWMRKNGTEPLPMTIMSRGVGTGVTLVAGSFPDEPPAFAAVVIISPLP